MDRFLACLAFTLAPENEGGWSDNPMDPGGATMHGVTLANFRTWRHDPLATKAELRAIGDAELRAFYAVGYWQPKRCQDLPAGVDLMVFDFGVNAGTRESAMVLQQAVGVGVDGWVGPGTLAAVRTMDASDLVDALAAAQEAHYRSCKAFATFGRGWLARLDRRAVAAGDALPG